MSLKLIKEIFYEISRLNTVYKIYPAYKEVPKIAWGRKLTECFIWSFVVINGWLK